MIRKGIACAVLFHLGASLLCAQVPGSDTGQGTPSKSPSTEGATGGLGQGTIDKSSGTTSTGTSGLGSGTGTSSGTTPKKPAPGSLEDLIDKALRNNADIRAAEAKMREAEAELNRVRHQIVAKVATLKHDITTARKMLEFAEAQAAIVKETYRSGKVTQQEMHAALTAVEKQKADVARLETEMQSVTGSWKVISAAFSPDGKLLSTQTIDGTLRIWDTVSGRAVDWRTGDMFGVIDKSASLQTPMAERIKTALDKMVKIDVTKPEMPFHEALALVVQKAGVNVPFRPVGKLETGNILLVSGELPLGAWLQALEDSADVRFVVRDYGILITSGNRIPQGALTVQEFWKQSGKPKSDPAKGMAPTGSGPKTP